MYIRRACTARVTVVVPCVYVCLAVRSFLPPRACRFQNIYIGTNEFTAMHKQVVLLKMLRSEAKPSFLLLAHIRNIIYWYIVLPLGLSIVKSFPF